MAAILNLYSSWAAQWRGLLARLGLGGVRELRGRSDLLYNTARGFGEA